MVQGGLKKLAVKQKRASVAHRQSKTTRKGKRSVPSGTALAKAKKKLQGCYTAGLEGNLVGKMSSSEREKLKVVNTNTKDKPMTQEEKRAKARELRRNKKKGQGAEILREHEEAKKAKSLA